MPPTTRVVRLSNIHFDATEEDIRQFFQGYTVIDQVRAFDPWAVGTLSNVYVLFSTIGDMDAVVAMHQNRQIRGRHVNIVPAPIGNYDLDASCERFVRLGDNDTLSAAARKLATTLVRMASDDPAFKITREEEAGLRQELYQNTQEEHDRADSNKKNVLALVLHAYSKNLQRRSRDENPSKKPLYRAPSPVPVPFKHRVPSPDLQNREDPRNRVLLITGIPTEADNDAVMTFLRSYRPESIDRAQIGGNWMVSALVLMQTSEGRDRAVEEMSDQMIQGQRVVVHTFSNLTQEVLNRIINPGASVPDATVDLPARSGIARSSVPPAPRAPYPFSRYRVAQTPVVQMPSTSYSPSGSSSPSPVASAAPEPSVIASILEGLHLNQELSQAHSAQIHNPPSSSKDEERSSTEPQGTSLLSRPRQTSAGSNGRGAPVSVQPRQSAPQPSWMGTAGHDMPPRPNPQHAPRWEDYDDDKTLLPDMDRDIGDDSRSVLSVRGSPHQGPGPRTPAINTAREEAELDEVLRANGILLHPTRSFEDTSDRRNQTAAGNQGVNVTSEDRRINFRANLDRNVRERAQQQDAGADQVSREDAPGRSHSPQGRGRGWSDIRGRGRGRGRGDGRGGQSRGSRNPPGRFSGLSPNEVI